MNEKVVSLSAWKARKITNQTPSAISAGGDHMLRDVVRAMLDKTPESAEGKDTATSRMLLCMDLESRLSSFKLPVNQAKIAEYQRLANGYDDETLFNLARSATDNLLSTKPYFYQGLLAVARSRMLPAGISDSDKSE